MNDMRVSLVLMFTGGESPMLHQAKHRDFFLLAGFTEDRLEGCRKMEVGYALIIEYLENLSKKSLLP